jgi:hypothetical protein
MSGIKTPEGIQCECGLFAPFTPYVYAHMNVELVFVCPECGCKHIILQGEAKPKSKS